MTDDERRLLEDLADKIAKTPTPPKDPDAEQFIRTRIGSRPDALYLMTQTVLIQNLALQQAQHQIQQLQQGNQLPAGGGSFLGQQQQRPAPPPPQYAAPSPAAPSPAYAPAASSGAPSFLRGAAQTAAGVAAGALAFEGIQHLFSHPFGGGGGFFGGGGIGGYAPPVEENIVNNYYDSPADQGYDAGQDYQDQSNDPGNYDDSGNDGGNYDDSNNFDDGGGFDNGGGGDNFV